MSDPVWMVLVLARATAILVSGGILVVLLRRSSSAARHAVLGFTVFGLLVLPLLSSVLPRWELAVLPAGTSTPSPQAVRPQSGNPSQSTESAGSISVEADPAAVALAQRSRRDQAARSAIGNAGAPSDNFAAAAVGEEDRSREEGLLRLRDWGAAGWLFATWVVGAAIGVVRMARSLLLARRALRRATEVVEPDWKGEVEDAARVLGLRRSVRLLMSDAVRVPVVHGFRQPAILLPTSAVHWPEDRRRAFLLHELAHVRRQDWPVQMLGHLARALYWPHPLAWWVVRRLRIEAERASDDCVLLTGTPASDYAAHLLQAARDLGRAPQHAAVLAAVERSHFEARLIALLDPQMCRRALDRRVLGVGAVGALAVVLVVAALQPVARASGETPERPAEADRVTREPALPMAPVNGHDSVPLRTAASLPAPPPAAASPAPASGLSSPPPAEPPADATAVTDEEPGPLETEPGFEEVSSPAAQPTPEPSALPALGPRPVIRISTDLVQIDAVITDKQGLSVVDLRPEDFEVFEDGRKQNVTHLRYVAAGPGKMGNAGTPAATSQAGEPRSFVFVIDNLGLSLEGTARARRLVQSFVTSGLQPRDRAAIIETSARSGGTFALTSDPKVLSAAADKIHHIVWSRAGQGAFPDRNLDLTSRNDQLVMDSLAVLKNTIDALRALPGRKSVILVSDGLTSRISIDMDRLLQRFAATPMDSLYGDTTLYAALRSLTDLANRASVVIYTLDSTGLQTSSGGQVQTFGARWNPGDPRNGADTRDANGQLTAAGNPAAQAQLVRSVARTTREDSLIEIAEQTGGLAIFSTNDLAGGLARIVHDLSGYYLIGYVPDQSTFQSRPGPPRFHEVKVEVKRPGLKVRSRKGFYGVTDEFVAQASPPR